MACPICGANCRCKKRGPGGLCCGCHRHKAQKGMTRDQVDQWRAKHELEPIDDAQWEKHFEAAPAPPTTKGLFDAG